MDTQVRPELVDDMIDTYVRWREECLSLGNAYKRWANVSAAERLVAFAAYGAALDREEQASAAYAERVNRIAAEPAGASTQTP